MAQCVLCKKRLAEHNKKECVQCFIRRIEHSLRKQIRASKVMGSSSAVLIIDKKDAPSKVLEKIVSQIAKQQRKEVIAMQEQPDKIKDSKAILSPATMDELNAKFMSGILGSTSKENQNNLIFPLEKITREECENYCEIKKISFEKTNLKNDIEEFLQRIENSQPGTNFALSITRKNLHGKK